MTVGTNSYGTAAGVAQYVKRYAPNGSFSNTPTASNPTLAAVEGWIDQISAQLNTALSAAGFKIPITQADAKLACQQVVEQLTADLAQAANSAGRFYSERALKSGLSPFKAIQGDILAWAESMAGGLEAMGAARTIAANEYAIGSRDSDSVGDPTAPIFQRKGFGNKFQDWDQTYKIEGGGNNINLDPDGN
jgi:hypothetical protein